MVDCSIGFPAGGRDHTDGVEQLLPDMRPFADAPIAAVFLTHGHDDHIAALGHLIRAGAPIGRIVGLPFTAELARAKLAEWGPHPPIVTARPGTQITTGAFAVEWVNSLDLERMLKDRDYLQRIVITYVVADSPTMLYVYGSGKLVTQ